MSRCDGGGAASRAVSVGNARGKTELLQLADMPPLEVHLGPRLAARPQEHDPLVLQTATAGHLGDAAALVLATRAAGARVVATNLCALCPPRARLGLPAALLPEPALSGSEGA